MSWENKTPVENDLRERKIERKKERGRVQRSDT